MHIKIAQLIASQESVKAPTASSEGTMLKPSPRSLASTFPDYEGAGRRVGALMQATAMKFSTVAKLEEISLEKIVGIAGRVQVN